MVYFSLAYFTMFMKKKKKKMIIYETRYWQWKNELKTGCIIDDRITSERDKNDEHRRLKIASRPKYARIDIVWRSKEFFPNPKVRFELSFDRIRGKVGGSYTMSGCHPIF